MSASPNLPNEETGSRFWWVQEEDRIRGPYTGSQMLAFLLKGRLKPHSRVRPDTEPRWRPASEETAFAQYFNRAGVSAEPGRQAGSAGHRHRMPNFIIMVDGHAYPDGRIETVLGELGAHYRLMPHIWLLHCGLQVEKIRTYLVRQLGRIERLFIVDVSNATYASHQFDDHVEDQIRELLNPPEET